MPDPPSAVHRLAAERAQARSIGDFATADVIRDRIADAGWRVVDEPGGWRLEPGSAARPLDPLAAHDVPSALDVPATTDVSLHWVCEGWPEDIARAVTSFRAHAAGRSIQCVVADVTGSDAGAFGDGVSVIPLLAGTGWAAARNAGLRTSTGRTVVVLDGSIEASGDVLGPLEDALADPAIGLAGPFGLRTHDLRQFDEARAPGPCDAVEGYLMAMRRDLLSDVMFDEKFRWYRTADVELSFRVKDRGLSTVVIDVPVTRHPHRMWFETAPAERAKWSKRNFYRFLDRWRGRWDLVLEPEPPRVEPREPSGGRP